MLRQMLNNLHPAMNKDSQSIPALKITATNGTAIVQNNILQLTGPSSAQFNLRTYTLGSLVSAINGLTGFAATLYQPSSLAAVVLIDGTYTAPATISMFTAMLWQLLKPVALALIDALGAENQALLEMVMNTSDGAWLNSFGELFGVYRESGEPDQLYAIRVFDLSVGPRVNNMAIQKALQDLNYNATVDDAGTNATFDVNVTIPTSAPQGFVYSTSQIGDIVGLLKAAGTTANIVLQGSATDTVLLSDSVTSSTNNPNNYQYAGWTCSLLGVLYVMPSNGWSWGSGQWS